MNFVRLLAAAEAVLSGSGYHVLPGQSWTGDRGHVPACSPDSCPSATRWVARCILLFAVVLSVSFPVAGARAGQVTFAFDATVSQISETPGFAATFPFVPSVGQAMTGKVTFTPIPFGQIGDYDAKLEVAWQGESFAGESNQLFTLNDYPVTPGSPFDSLSVECDFSHVCAVAASFTVNVHDFGITLRSFTEDVVPGGQLIDSVEAWNRFPNRELLVSFSDANDFVRMGVWATVGAMRVVPEPFATQLTLAAILACCTFRTLGRRRRRAFFGIAVLILVLGSALAPTHAAQITFTFDATVTLVPADFSAVGLPFSLSVGQKFSGEYSFANAQDMFDVFFPSYPNGLGKSGAVIVTINSVVGTASVNMGSLSDGALLIPTDPRFGASLSLGYVSPTDVVPPWNGGIAGQRFNTALMLAGSYGSFTSKNELFDPSAWNRLTSQREFDLRFAYYAGTNINYVTVQTQIGDFRAVPEPTTMRLNWMCTAYCLIHVSRRVRNVGVRASFREHRRAG